MSGRYTSTTRGLRLGKQRRRSKGKKNYETVGVGAVRQVIIHTCAYSEHSGTQLLDFRMGS